MNFIINKSYDLSHLSYSDGFFFIFIKKLKKFCKKDRLKKSYNMI